MIFALIVFLCIVGAVWFFLFQRPNPSTPANLVALVITVVVIVVLALWVQRTGVLKGLTG